MHLINHPQAQFAVNLASIPNLPRGYADIALREARCPRRLYTLARILRAAKMMDELAAADHKARLDAINAAHPAVVHKAA